ncbi:DsrE family protein [Sandaracinobacteroides hominis]|uniref:DsrE family protein n=1 Tax=Sandaracinobacteroides hominis TaxID=2780086 RepID=UPI0018F4602A|nr:DsrE family protein [Sandaracinobacteroides hominis]
MPGLLLIVTDTGGERFNAAMELAAATAALGRPVALLLRGPAILDLARKPVADALSTLHELGAHIAACQTAMATHHLAADQLPDGVEPLGMIAFLSGRSDWQTLLI